MPVQGRAESEDQLSGGEAGAEDPGTPSSQPDVGLASALDRGQGICKELLGRLGPQGPCSCRLLWGPLGAREALPAPLPLAPELPSPPPSLPPSFSCLSSLPLCLSPAPRSPAQSWPARCPLGVGGGRRFSLLTLESDLRVGGVVTGTHILGDLTLRVLS